MSLSSYKPPEHHHQQYQQQNLQQNPLQAQYDSMFSNYNDASKTSPLTPTLASERQKEFLTNLYARMYAANAIAQMRQQQQQQQQGPTPCATESTVPGLNKIKYEIDNSVGGNGSRTVTRVHKIDRDRHATSTGGRSRSNLSTRDIISPDPLTTVSSPHADTFSYKSNRRGSYDYCNDVDGDVGDYQDVPSRATSSSSLKNIKGNSNSTSPASSPTTSPFSSPTKFGDNGRRRGRINNKKTPFCFSGACHANIYSPEDKIYCPDCHTAFYCSRKCMEEHKHTHSPYCIQQGKRRRSSSSPAKESRYSGDGDSYDSNYSDERPSPKRINTGATSKTEKQPEYNSTATKNNSGGNNPKPLLAAGSSTCKLCGESLKRATVRACPTCKARFCSDACYSLLHIARCGGGSQL